MVDYGFQDIIIQILNFDISRGSVPRYNMFGGMGIGHKGTDREGIRQSTPATR